jgi:hypothetical protein
LGGAKDNRYGVFVSPHYCYLSQLLWRFGGTFEHGEDELNPFARKGPLTPEGFAGSWADWLARDKPEIEDGQTVVVSAHKVYGPESNDQVLQLRRFGIGKVILGACWPICVSRPTCAN